MHYHILLSEECNLQCKYCYKKSMEEFDNGLNKRFKFDFSSPPESTVDLKKLKRFLLKDKDAVLVFYGGEPLNNIEKLKRIMDEIHIPMRMQTNAIDLDKLPAKYVNRIKKILVSIDGTEKITDHFKGKGVYKKIINNLNLIKENGYNGEIIARMTLSPDYENNIFPDIYEQVQSLLDNGFTSIHWQLDAGFYKFDYDERFKDFITEYNKSISRLIKFWIKEMESGTVLRLYPFLGIMESLLKDETTELRCGAGHSGYAITTDGKVVACPIMNCIEDFLAGDLSKDPNELKRFKINGRCKACDYLDLCGGRCLYWNKTELWPKEGDELICNSIKHLIDELKKQLPKIQGLIDERFISKKQFNYEKYFGPEIIP